MKKYGIISYNHYVNFVNFGSILQTYALQQALDQLHVDNVIVDYTPKSMLHADKDNPMPLFQEADAVSRHNLELSLPDIHKANQKFDAFWALHCRKTEHHYDADHLSGLNLDGYICGSDTIWNLQEFQGFDPGFWADAPAMKGKYNITYSASIGDGTFSVEEKQTLSEKIKNFMHISMREDTMLPELESVWGGHLYCTVDPTLLLDCSSYEKLEVESPLRPKKKYVLLYSRQYNPEMNAYADRLAEEYDLEVLDISLRYLNKDHHIMAYNTGIEEFLDLVHHAETVVTNSFHGAIFAIQYRRPFHVFFRNGTASKTQFLLDRFGLSERHISDTSTVLESAIDWDSAWKSIVRQRQESFDYLRMALEV